MKKLLNFKIVLIIILLFSKNVYSQHHKIQDLDKRKSSYNNALERIYKNYLGKDLEVYKIISVYDGDTFRAILTGDNQERYNNISIRIAGIDTAEIKAKCDYEKKMSVEARNYLKKLLLSGKAKINNIKKGKYYKSRLIANVIVDSIEVSKLLINKGLANPYNGYNKISWCK